MTTDFYGKLDGYIGTNGADITDIRAVVRRCWFYDFDGYPVRLWKGQGRLYTEDGNEWLGTLDANNRDVHIVPSILDGRDGSSATYDFGLRLIDVPGTGTAQELHDALKKDQWRVAGRKLTAYYALFEVGEGLRPNTPIVFFKELTMMSTRFSEKIDVDGNGTMVKHYQAWVTCKDANFGRASIPGGTYADAVQKERARQLGVTTDKGCEFLAKLANRTYQLP